MKAIALMGWLAMGSMAMGQDGIPMAGRWLDAAGPVPAFEIPGSREAWDARRPELRRQLTALLGRLPARPAAPRVEVVAREEREGYRVERFRFDNGAGAMVPGYVLLPAGRPGRGPGILYCHWHGGQFDIGKEELFQTNAVPVPPGPALARLGYVVVAIDAYCFGERNGQGPGGPEEKGAAGEMTASKFNLWMGRTLWGMIVRDDLMALDYLASRPEVDPDRIGVTGISMGSTRTWWLLALDDRPRTGVGIACLTRYQDLIASGGLKYHGIYYFVPGMLSRFDTEAVVSLIAPRPMLFQTGDRDAGSPEAGIRRIESAVRQIYRLYGREAAFENVVVPELGHAYTPAMWQRTLRWLEEHL